MTHRRYELLGEESRSGSGRGGFRADPDRGRQLAMSSVSERARTTEVPVVVIQPARGWTSLQLKDLWAYRELLYFLVWRDVKVRYKQTALGVAWAVLQPADDDGRVHRLLRRARQIGSDGLPYPIFSSRGSCPGPSSRRA